MRPTNRGRPVDATLWRYTGHMRASNAAAAVLAILLVLALSAALQPVAGLPQRCEAAGIAHLAN